MVSQQPPFYSRNTAEMYDNILNKPLQLKPNISNAARHLLEGLLQKDKTKRLGFTDDFVSVLEFIYIYIVFAIKYISYIILHSTFVALVSNVSSVSLL